MRYTSDGVFVVQPDDACHNCINCNIKDLKCPLVGLLAAGFVTLIDYELVIDKSCPLFRAKNSLKLVKGGKNGGDEEGSIPCTEQPRGDMGKILQFEFRPDTSR